jgi:hypothetical protein
VLSVSIKIEVEIREGNKGNINEIVGDVNK